MQEVEDAGHGGAEALDFAPVQDVDFFEQLLLSGGRQAAFQKLTEGPLVVLVLVNVRDAQLGLPVERVGRALEHLLLLADDAEHEFERGALKIVAKAAGLNVLDHLLHPASDGAEGLQAFLVIDKPRIVNGLGISFVLLNKRW